MKTKAKTETVQSIRVDFSKVSVQLAFEGDPVIMDVRKIVGNNIRKGTADIGLDDLARTIYFSDGEVEIPECYTEAVALIIGDSSIIVPVKEAIKSLLTI